MDYQVALPKDLEVDAATFAAAWNEEPDCRAVAEARVEPQAAVAFPIGTATLVVLGMAAAGLAQSLAGEAAKDLVKDKIKKILGKLLGWDDGRADAIVIHQWENADGSRGLYVRIGGE